MNVIIICNILLFCLSILMAVLFLHSARKSRAFLDKSVNRTMNKAKHTALKRKEKEEALRMEDGKQEKTSFLFRIDVSLAQSGLSERLPFLNTELFLGFVIVTVAAGFILGLGKGLLVGIIAAFVIAFLHYLLLYLLTARNYNRTEKQIIRFVGMLKNYARTSDDLMAIFRSVTVYLDEPLKSIVEECQAEAVATGDLSAAMMRMELKIEHKEMKKILGNLEICARRKANYEVIIDRSMEQIRSYIATTEENKKMISGARKTILMILAVGALSIGMMNDFAEGGIIPFLRQSFVGECILFYLFFILLYTAWKMISMGKKS